MTAPVNPEGQTAQEVRRAVNDGRQSAYVHVLALVASCLRAAEDEDRALASTPSPAKQTEQKIASAEGAASQLGAAPATPLDLLRIGPNSLPPGPSALDRLLGARPAAPAQPDARDAEIARLTKELEEARAAYEEEWTALPGESVADLMRKATAEAFAEHARFKERGAKLDAAEAQAKALREALRNVLMVCGGYLRLQDPRLLADARAVLAPPEPKAETPAETAGQKEGLARPLVYLACPYSHPDREVRASRWALVNYAAGELMAKGEKVFSPISHTHPIAEAHDLPLGWDFWEAFDRAYIGHSHKLIVLMLDGWMESKGVQAEIAIAQEMGIPVEYMDPPAPPSLHPAQPSQDVAGTSGESLAGLSKEGSET